MGWDLLVITVYISSNCPYCRKVTDYLTLNGYEFVEVNVSKDIMGMKHLKKLGINCVPVTEGNNWRVIGYDVNSLKEKLKSELSKDEKMKVQAKLRKLGFM